MGRNRRFRVTTQIAGRTPDRSKSFNAGHTSLFSAPLGLATDHAAKTFTNRLFSAPTHKPDNSVTAFTIYDNYNLSDSDCQAFFDKMHGNQF